MEITYNAKNNTVIDILVLLLGGPLLNLLLPLELVLLLGDLLLDSLLPLELVLLLGDLLLDSQLPLELFLSAFPRLLLVTFSLFNAHISPQTWILSSSETEGSTREKPTLSS